MKKILIISGANLRMLGKREGDNENYSYNEMVNELKVLANERGEIEFFQDDVEGEIIKKINASMCDAIIINAGSLAFTSISIRDSLQIKKCKKIEVYINNLAKNETIKQTSLLTAACDGLIMGFGIDSYKLALNFILENENN